MVKTLWTLVVSGIVGLAAVGATSCGEPAPPAAGTPGAAAPGTPAPGAPAAGAPAPNPAAPNSLAPDAGAPNAAATPGAVAPTGAAPAGAAPVTPPPPTAPAAGAASAATSASAAPRVEYREITLPAGTVLPLTLDSSVASDTSRVEDPVNATLRRAVVVDGQTVLPAGTPVSGIVTDAQRPGKVKGRGLIGVRFTNLSAHDERYAVQTARIVRQAPGTKKKDAAKIGVPAGAGALIGAIAGGKKGAAIGGAVGGGGGTAVVLSTRGKEVRLGRGAALSPRLTEPLTVRVPIG